MAKALSEARKEAGQLDAQIAVYTDTIADVADEIRSKRRELPAAGQSLLDALQSAEEAILEYTAVIDGSLSRRIQKASFPPVTIVASLITETDERKLTAETRALVRRLIDQLPDDFRTILLLRDIEELSTEEAANALQITVGAAKVAADASNAEKVAVRRTIPRTVPWSSARGPSTKLLTFNAPPPSDCSSIEFDWFLS